MSKYPAVRLIWRGIESYLQELIANAVRSQVTNAGLMAQVAVPTSEPVKVGATARMRHLEKKLSP